MDAMDKKPTTALIIDSGAGWDVKNIEIRGNIYTPISPPSPDDKERIRANTVTLPPKPKTFLQKLREFFTA